MYYETSRASIIVLFKNVLLAEKERMIYKQIKICFNKNKLKKNCSRIFYLHKKKVRMIYV